MAQSLLTEPSPHPLDDLKPGHWYAATDQLSYVLPSPKPYGSTGPRAIMSAWSGACYDTTREQLLVHGGGHGDSSDNSIYAFNLESLTWSRLWGPTPNDSILPLPNVPWGETYADGSPRARHTYGGLQVIPALGALWMWGGSLWSGSGGMGKATWLFDLEQKTWTRRSSCPYPIGCQPFTAYDRLTGHVYCHAYARLYSYDPLSDIWQTIGGYPPGASPNANMILHEKEQQLYLIGDGKVYMYDLETTPSAMQCIYKTSDVTKFVGGIARPAVAYDTKREQIIAWAGSTSVYTFDVETYAWIEHKAAATNTVTPSRIQPAGTFGRCQYLEAYDVLMLVNSIDTPAFFCKLS